MNALISARLWIVGFELAIAQGYSTNPGYLRRLREKERELMTAQLRSRMQ